MNSNPLILIFTGVWDDFYVQFTYPINNGMSEEELLEWVDNDRAKNSETKGKKWPWTTGECIPGTNIEIDSTIYLLDGWVYTLEEWVNSFVRKD